MYPTKSHPDLLCNLFPFHVDILFNLNSKLDTQLFRVFCCHRVVMSSVSVLTVATGQKQHELPTNQRQVGQAFSAQAQSKSDRSGRSEETSRGRTTALQERGRTQIVSGGEEGCHIV